MFDDASNLVHHQTTQSNTETTAVETSDTLSDCSVATDINVVGNWIYYISSSGGMYRMKTDGCQNQIVPD